MHHLFIFTEGLSIHFDEFRHPYSEAGYQQFLIRVEDMELILIGKRRNIQSCPWRILLVRNSLEFRVRLTLVLINNFYIFSAFDESITHKGFMGSFLIVTVNLPVLVSVKICTFSQKSKMARSEAFTEIDPGKNFTSRSWWWKSIYITSLAYIRSTRFSPSAPGGEIFTRIYIGKSLTSSHFTFWLKVQILP